MPLKWVDELNDSEPLPALEPFFILMAIELGDPDAKGWLMNSSPTFHDLYRKYRREITECGREPVTLPKDGASVLIQYLVWYDRESRRIKDHG